MAAAAWTAAGHKVLAWDPDPELRAGLAAARGAVVEPGVDEAIKAAIELPASGSPDHRCG